jgi:hypothetical protein
MRRSYPVGGALVGGGRITAGAAGFPLQGAVTPWRLRYSR